MSTFVKRKITVTFALPQGSFAGTQNNQVVLEGLRVSATVVKTGGTGMFRAQILIYGLSQELMNQLSTYGMPPNTATAARVQVEAGDDINGMAIVHVGFIASAWADYSRVPEVAFNIDSYVGSYDAIKAVTPNSFAGTADAADVMSKLASTMGYTFENNGVSVKLANPYFWGTARVQAEECAREADINWVIDNGVLAIWPKNAFRKGSTTIIDAQNNMIGYPTFTLNGIDVRAILDPKLKFGSTIQVNSSLQPATGQWVVNNILYELESETPNGKWEMSIRAYKASVAPQ